MAGAAKPMPHQPGDATAEHGTERRSNLGRCGAIGMMKKLQVPITLTTAGGLSSALGTATIACDRLLSGKFDAIVMPEIPSVISVGELC
eukprot:3776672-Pyramimonas_sp.AAC.1